MLHSTNFSALAERVTSLSLPSSPGISVPGRPNQGLEVRPIPSSRRHITKEES